MQSDEKASVTLRLPSTLSAYSGGKSQIAISANTVAELLTVLKEQQPLVWERLCNEQGYLREHVKMFVSNEVISETNGLDTPLISGQEVIVLPAISHS